MAEARVKDNRDQGDVNSEIISDTDPATAEEIEASAAITTKKRNAFSELMSPKPKQRPTPTPSSTAATGGASKSALRDFGYGLSVYLDSPTSYPQQVILTNASFVVIHDLFPKASVHLLILPRDPSKNLLHPFEALEDAEFLASVRRQAEDVRRLAASELRRRFGKFSALERERERVMEERLEAEGQDDAGATTSSLPPLPPGRDWESELLIGIHAHPSMHHLHIHVLSKDRYSPALKHRKHYNSFSTPFFVPLDDFPLAADDVRRHPGREGYLKRDFVCWRCGKGFGSGFTKLKQHLEEEFETWKRI